MSGFVDLFPTRQVFGSFERGELIADQILVDLRQFRIKLIEIDSNDSDSLPPKRLRCAQSVQTGDQYVIRREHNRIE
jgi:hypothetical protein